MKFIQKEKYTGFPLISIIIVNYNGRELLRLCLESVFAQSLQDIEVIAVDNGSADGSVEYIRENFPAVEVVALPSNIGFPGANNEGIKHAKGSFIMLLNNDVEADKDCLAGLVSAMEKDTSVGICATKMLVAGTDLIDSAGDGFSSNLKGFKRGEGKPAHLYNENEYVFGACAGAAMYRRKMIEEIGFLDEDFFLIYEDADFNLRAQLAGWKVKYVPSAVVHHKVRSTIGNMSDTAVFYSLRNSELTRMKNIPSWVFIRCLPAYILGTLLEFLFFVVRHGRLKLYVRAKLDALRLLPKMLKKRKAVMRIRKVSNGDLYSLITSICSREFFTAKISKFLHG
ncbi:MAG: glycosyltransferase family 2 protein [Thermodesulfovibrionales bacterium]